MLAGFDEDIVAAAPKGSDRIGLKVDVISTLPSSRRKLLLSINRFVSNYRTVEDGQSSDLDRAL